MYQDVQGKWEVVTNELTKGEISRVRNVQSWDKKIKSDQKLTSKWKSLLLRPCIPEKTPYPEMPHLHTVLRDHAFDTKLLRLLSAIINPLFDKQQSLSKWLLIQSLRIMVESLNTALVALINPHWENVTLLSSESYNYHAGAWSQVQVINRRQVLGVVCVGIQQVDKDHDQLIFLYRTTAHCHSETVRGDALLACNWIMTLLLLEMFGRCGYWCNSMYV